MMWLRVRNLVVIGIWLMVKDWIMIWKIMEIWLLMRKGKGVKLKEIKILKIVR